MTRIQRAIKFAIENFVEQNPQWSDKEYRKEMWRRMSRIEKEMFLDMLSMSAEWKLEEAEPLTST